MEHQARRRRRCSVLLLAIGFILPGLWGCGGSGEISVGDSAGTSIRVVFPEQKASLLQPDPPEVSWSQPSSPPITLATLLAHLKDIYAVRLAFAQVVPANVGRLLLVVTGPGLITPIETTIDIVTGRATVNVPIGNDRVFEVRAFAVGSSTLNFIGRATANVPATGASVVVNMLPVTLNVPVANAGPDQTVFVTQTVQLDGSASSDADGDPLTFRWALTSRPPASQATLAGPTLVNPSFVVDEPGIYVVQLIVNDGFLDSLPDTVTITTQNSRPVANAGPDQTVFVGTTVQLDGSGSSDVDDDLLTFRWAFTSLPPGSEATLSEDTAVNPSFVVDEPGAYAVQLIVNDGTLDSLPDTVTITTQNSRPVANAGPDQTVFVTQTVQLDGSGSSDVDGEPLTFRWALTSRPPASQATLAGPTLVNPSFVVDEPGIYVVQLIVNDGFLDSLPDTVTITTQNSRPVANAGPDQTVFVGTTVQLDGSQSSDVDDDLLTFRWAFTSLPSNSRAILFNPTLVNPSFVVDEPGIYVVQLIVNDGFLDSLPDTVTITASSAPTPDLFPVPDPLVSGPSAFCRIDSLAFALIVTVGNQGTATAPPSDTTVRFLPGGTFSQATPSIAPNGSVDLVFDFPSGCFDPDCNFIISVDAADDIAEVSERNNLARGLCVG